MPDLTGPTVPNIAQKLTLLIETVRHPDGRPYSDNEIAEAVGCSNTNVWLLRTGRRDNPTLQTLAGLAKFFGVQPSYFVDTGSTMADAMNDAGVAHLAARAQGLSPDALRTIIAVVEQIRRSEIGYPNG